jgi:DHA2 family multidrug resistance protein
VAQGAGLYNLFRQLGGSFGIAVLATQLDHRAKVHFAYLTEHVSVLSPLAQQRSAALESMYLSRGLDSASALDAAQRTLAATLHQQAMALSFEDAYRMILVAVIASLPLVFLLRREKPHPN